MILKYKYIAVLTLGLMICSGVMAQSSQTSYFMNLPQNREINPALRPYSNVYVGLPVLSGIGLSLGNNLPDFSDIFMNSGDSVRTVLHPDYDIMEFLDKLKDRNSIDLQTSMQLLGVGFAVGKNYFSLDVSTKINASIAAPGDFFGLLLAGNEQYVGSTIDFSSLSANAMAYHEIGFGLSRDVTDRLRIGLKAKALMGIATVITDVNKLGIDVRDDYTHSLNADMALMVSAPLGFATSADNKIDSVYGKDYEVLRYLTKADNLGFGLDLGAEFQITPRLNVAAAVTDLGFINWKRDATTVQADGQFTFSGFDVSDVISGEMSFDSLSTELGDSLSNALNMRAINGTFTTYLPVSVNLAGSFAVTDFFSLGILSRTRFINNGVKEALTLSANVNLKSSLSSTVSYTMSNGSYDNFGFGLAFKLGVGQIYVLADKIPLTYNKIITQESGKGIKIPADMNYMNFRFGINLIFGNRQKIVES